ncbi:hypothetical protein [Dyadobacter sp. BHUBP1]|uniref:hypothetical protein n=1 Tax=Dyadobacter sp. BHUBP1 TaxID=3424178 RepID=UPI003D32B6CB
MQNELETASNGYNLKPGADKVGEIGLNKTILKPECKKIGNASQAGQYKDDPGSENIPDNSVQDINQVKFSS